MSPALRGPEKKSMITKTLVGDRAASSTKANHCSTPMPGHTRTLRDWSLRAAHSESHSNSFSGPVVTLTFPNRAVPTRVLPTHSTLMHIMIWTECEHPIASLVNWG